MNNVIHFYKCLLFQATLFFITQDIAELLNKRLPQISAGFSMKLEMLQQLPEKEGK